MDTNKKEILEALEKYKGIVTNACGSIGLSRSTYYNWLQTDTEFKDAVDDIQETAIDFVEGKLMEKISGVTMLAKYGDKDADPDEEPTYTVAPSDTAIIFYLKTKGKKRGYVEKTEIDHTTKGDSLNKSKDLSMLSDEELKQMALIQKKINAE